MYVLFHAGICLSTDGYLCSFYVLMGGVCYPNKRKRLRDTRAPGAGWLAVLVSLTSFGFKVRWYLKNKMENDWGRHEAWTLASKNMHAHICTLVYIQNHTHARVHAHTHSPTHTQTNIHIHKRSIGDILLLYEKYSRYIKNYSKSEAWNRGSLLRIVLSPG